VLCHVQVDGNVVSGNQIQVLREKVKRQERGTYVAFFSITLFGAFWAKKEKEIRSWSTWFFWFASTVGFSLRKIFCCTAVLLESFV
jgi:hypothetical protein